MATLTLVDDPWQERLDAVDRSPQVDIDDPPPVVVRHLGHWPADRDPGVVEHDVHGTEQAERLIGQALHRGERADVARHTVCFDARVSQPVDRGDQRDLLDVGQHDAGAVPPAAGEPSPVRSRSPHR